jgi:uncharacterized membrane protein
MAKSTTSRGWNAEDELAEDPYMMQFDKGIALLGYGLLFVSPFMVGLPAMASFALALSHRNDAHPIIRSHYRFQSGLFWTTLALLAVGVSLLLLGGGLAFTTLAGSIQAHLTGVTLPEWLVGGYLDRGERDAGNWMMVGGIACLAVALVRLLAASVWGAFKLVLGRSMGLRR